MDSCPPIPVDPIHPGEPCCQTPRGGCSASLQQAMEPPAGAYVAPQEAAPRSVGKVERKRRRGLGLSMSKLMAVAERETNGRSKL